MRRILIVDDDPAIRDLLREVLVDEGYDVLTAGDGQTALEVTRAQAPALILMDLMLPFLDGVAATRALKADSSTQDIPIIAMSAGANLRQMADVLPADAVISKPFDLDGLLAEIAIQLRHASARTRSFDEPPAR